MTDDTHKNRLRTHNLLLTVVYGKAQEYDLLVPPYPSVEMKLRED
jgi:hypothetical protein